MSCCGNKRKEWLREAKRSTGIKSTEAPLSLPNLMRPEKVFEYTGKYSLIIKGATSGKLYRFQYKGDKVKVEYLDSFAMMAERDLRVSS